MLTRSLCGRTAAPVAAYSSTSALAASLSATHAPPSPQTSTTTTTTVHSGDAAGVWSAQQRCFRALMKALRAAYFHDRARLFWARHRVLVEFYKYADMDASSNDVKQLLGVAHEVAAFVEQYMKMDVERIVRHNDTMMKLPVDKAKRFREAYLLHEKQHEVWCKQRIRGMLDRRPPPPYPFF